MFTPSDVQKVVYVVDTSRAAETLEFLRGKRKQGRPTGLTTRLFLIGALLSALEGDGMVLKNIYDVLTRRMDFQWQVRLGIRTSVCASPTFTQDAVDRLSVSIRDVLECGEDSAPAVPAAERADRRDALLDVIDSMLDVTLIQTHSSYRSIDATGVWAWGKSPRSGGAKALAKEADALAAAGHADDAAVMRDVVDRMNGGKGAAEPIGATDAAALDEEPDDGGDEPIDEVDEQQVNAAAPETSGKSAHDPDARSSGKTAKDGRTEWFYGYHLHALVRVAEPGQEYRSEPCLIERIVVTPAGREMIWASRELVERAQPSEYERMLLGDRWYSNLTEANWYSFLRQNGWDQAVDMREGDQRWTDVHGARVTAGWLHCPATPDHLERIVKPVGRRTDFFETIEERRRWAFDLKEDDPVAGTRRFTCPAAAGKLRCPLREGSVAVQKGLPLVTNAPDADTAPRCCHSATITVHASDPNAKARLWQRKYWGTKDQVAQTDRRTSVEQCFSRLKDRGATNMTRGFVRVTGLARVTLAVGLLAVAANIRELEDWAETHDDGRAPGHPLLQPREPWVVLCLSDERAAAFLRWEEQQADAAA